MAAYVRFAYYCAQQVFVRACRVCSSASYGCHKKENSPVFILVPRRLFGHYAQRPSNLKFLNIKFWIHLIMFDV